jgi:hypothetical protein
MRCNCSRFRFFFFVLLFLHKVWRRRRSGTEIEEEEEEEAVYLRFSMSHWHEFSSLLFLGPRAFGIVTAAEVYGFGIAAS